MSIQSNLEKLKKEGLSASGNTAIGANTGTNADGTSFDNTAAVKGIKDRQTTSNTYDQQVAEATRNNGIEKKYQDNKSIAQRVNDLNSGNTTWDMDKKDKLAIAGTEFAARQKSNAGELASATTLSERKLAEDGSIKRTELGILAEAPERSAKLTKSTMDNDLQKATQPGSIKAINAGNVASISESNAATVIGQRVKADTLRKSIGSGFDVSPEGNIGLTPGDFLPGASGRIRGDKIATPTAASEAMKSIEADSMFRRNSVAVGKQYKKKDIAANGYTRTLVF